ncbi:class IIb bacteriocin, lactobin A/cerein 7B family [Butyrivibrio sp. WCE2006]|uniref:class IIb bacteriocin, lactobin A/cerein 7B family n=1 Tax=Butyrivibrio sp. WCE2006 TaxID=1410611 RepID=UPI0005D28198|nr:class IIb bacteriocin, lactobin A/cerein 7B family [Butyrivibrio sp. WCE2006]
MSDKDLMKELNDEELEEINGGAGIFANAGVGVGGIRLSNTIMTSDTEIASNDLLMSGDTNRIAGPLKNAVKVNNVKVKNTTGSNNTSGGGMWV